MMDFDYFDSEPYEVDDPEQKADELSQLREIADKIGSYRWQYKDEFAGSHGTDTEEHIGPIAQQLLGIPGLDAAVKTNEDGTYMIDTNYLSLATFSMLAALARVVLNGENNETNEDIPSGVPSAETEGRAPEEITGAGSPAEEAEQVAGVEPAEAGEPERDNGK